MKIRRDVVVLAVVIGGSAQVACGQDVSSPEKQMPLHGQIEPLTKTKQPGQAGSTNDVTTSGSYESPTTSSDLRPESLYLPPVGQVLKSTAEIVLVQGQVIGLKASPVANYRGPHLQFFQMHFKNASDQVAIVDADNTQAVAEKGEIRHANASAVIKGASNNLTPKGKALVTGVSLISLGLAGPIFYEMMTPSEHAKRYMGHAVGVDGIRHDVEDGRFGRRLLMPGDETTGWVAFESAGDESIKSLKIPVWFAPMRSPATYLNLPVKQDASL